MKKFILFALITVLAFSLFSLSASAEADVKVEIDGKEINCVDVNGDPASPLLIEGTTYLPVRAVSEALGVSVEWDNDTRSVFIDGKPEKAELGKEINIFIKGAKLTARDADGDVVNPIIKDGSTYLPIRAIGNAFDKSVSWENATRTASLTTPTYLKLDENKTYAIINKASGKAISVSDSGLVTEKYESYTYQAFKFTPSDVDGYYYINSVSSGKNFDVNGNSFKPGANIITYNAGTADNQKFAAVKADGGIKIYARSSKLPIEDSADKVKQNKDRESLVQLWDIVETTPVEKKTEAFRYTISSGGVYLSDTDSLTSSALTENQSFWTFTSADDNGYMITNTSTNKSLDVANNSTKSGDPIITYASSGNQNQIWLLELNDDGTYKIKSAYSDLYLAIENGKVVQSEKATDWTVK